MIKNPCIQISLKAETISDIQYIPGDSELLISIADFIFTPVEVANKCPPIIHEYSYTLLCGDIENDWLELNPSQKKVTLETPKTIAS